MISTFKFIMSRIDNKIIKSIISESISLDENIFNEIRKIIPSEIKISGYTSAKKVTFKNNRLLGNVISQSKLYTGDPNFARLILKAWYKNKKNAIDIVQDKLVKSGYKIKVPDFTKTTLEFATLNEEDIYKVGDISYFRPDGEKIENLSDEDASIAAALLGWLVLPANDIKYIEDNDLPRQEETTLLHNESNLQVEQKFEIQINNKITKEATEIIQSNESSLDEMIEDLEVGFKQESKYFSEITQNLIEGKLPEIATINQRLNSLNTKLLIIKDKLGILDSAKNIDLKILREIYGKYKEQNYKNESEKQLVHSLINQVLSISHKKGNEEDFLAVLKNLALDFKSDVELTPANKYEWYIKMINQEHYFNFLIDAIKESLRNNYNEELLDKYLSGLEKEFNVNNLNFYNALAKQINRSNLYFTNEVLPLQSNLIEESEADSYQTQDFNNNSAIEQNDDYETRDNSQINAESINENDNTEEIIESTDREDELKSNNVNKDGLSENEILVTSEQRKLEEINFSEQDNNILKLLEIDEPELAYHLAKCYEKYNIDLLLPSHFLNNLFLSYFIRSSPGSLAKKIEKNLVEYCGIKFEKNEKVFFLNQMIFATVLQPYLFAYNDIVGVININDIHSGPRSELFNLKNLISDFMAQYSGIITLDRIHQITDQSGHVAEKEKFEDSLKDWLNEASAKVFNSKPRNIQSQIFKKWVLKNGSIYNILMTFLNNPSALTLNKTLQNLDLFSWEKDYERERDRDYRNAYLSQAWESKKADDWFKNQIEELFVLVEQGRGYYKNDEKGFRQASEILHKFIQDITKEFKNVEELIGKQCKENRLAKISSHYLLKAIQNIREVLKNENKDNRLYSIAKIENKSLLKLKFYDSDIEWNPIEYNQHLADIIVGYIDNPVSSIEEVVRGHLKMGNFESIKRLNSISEITVPIDSQMDASDYLDKFKRELSTAKALIEKGCAYGYVMSENRSALISSVDIIEEETMRSYDGINFPLRKAQLDKIMNDINSNKERLLIEYRNQIPKDIKREFTDKLTSYLEKSNFIVFNETLERMKAKHFIIPDENKNMFKDFYQIFLKKAKSIETSSITEAISKRLVYHGIDFANIENFQTNQAKILFSKWHSVKNIEASPSKKTLELKSTAESFEVLKQFLEGLGFESINFTEADSYNKIVYFDFECRPIKGRAKSPLPQFGSIADGQYRLICVKKQMTEEDFVDNIKELTPSTNRAVIVFNFSWLTQEQRLEIAKLSKNEKISALVLDEAMLVYLLGIKESKMLSFIKLSAPFTFAEPYQTTSSNLPEEMFYGRKNQIDKLKNIHGDFSCLIYGGRQLGKTVLQRQVERIFTQPEKFYYAIYIDLRNSGIGLWDPIEKINYVLLEKFRTIPGMIPEKYKENSGLSILITKIKEWIDQNNGRILLFLDESDKFIKEDSIKEWKYLLPLKGLMEETEKRFKVVFSGLHDVRKTINIPNNPLAHFGSPICIGPMLETEELIEAQLLVKLPLETVGAEFDSDDLVFTILSHCNWYPSLIQIFCSKLLSVLHEKRSISELPMKIKSDDVTKAYERSRNLIKEKFNLTLSLDERYNLLANIIASETLGNPLIHSYGIGVEDIAKSASFYWEEGFDSLNTKVEVLNLMEEMVDLGILKMIKHGYVALRTPNLLGLIGDEKQITDYLLKKERVAPQEYKRETSRIIYNHKSSREVMSPFPAFYYDKLLKKESGTVIFKGSTMGGIEYVADFLNYRTKEINLINLYLYNFDSIDSNELWKYIDNKRVSEKHSIILFGTDKQYAYDDIVKANEKILKRNSSTVLFLLNPICVWSILSEDVVKPFDRLENQMIQVFNLPQWKPEIARDWFRETGCVTADISEIFKKLNVWHKLLDDYHEQIVESPELWNEKLIKFENTLLHNSYEIYKDFGLLDDNHVSSIKELIDWEGLSREDYISENVFGQTADVREKILEYFLSLNLIDIHLKVNPFVIKLLTHE